MKTLGLVSSIFAAVFLAHCTEIPKKNFNEQARTEEAAPARTGNASVDPVDPSLPQVDKPSSDPTAAQKDNTTFTVLTDEEALHGLKEGEAQIKIVCDRNVGKANKVTTAFCGNSVRPKSLVELQAALGLAFPATVDPGRGNNGRTGNGPAFVIQGHSSSLVGKFVSAINPRIILMSRANNDLAMGFVRGEQFAELAVKNADNTFDFFLVGFKQACNARPEGCNAGELLTDAIEKNWTAFTLYQDEDLKNSIVDCRHCHQPDGPQTQKILRMQELSNPWTHWFRDNTDGALLAADYQAAWGTDGVGGIPGSMITSSNPPQLENFIRENNMVYNENAPTAAGSVAQQPNEFLGALVRNELEDFAGKSPTAEALKRRFIARKDLSFSVDQAGNLTPLNTPTATAKNYIPIPYFDLRVADPTLQAGYVKQIQDFKAGTITLAQFKDIRAIFPADQQKLADIGFAVGPGESPQNMLALACSQCHHSGLDQAQSRAKFNAVDFSKMANLNEELDLAISRLKLGYTPERLKASGIKVLGPDGSQVALEKGEHLLTMPPRRFKSLSDTQIDALIQYLQSQKK